MKQPQQTSTLLSIALALLSSAFPLDAQVQAMQATKLNAQSNTTIVQRKSQTIANSKFKATKTVKPEQPSLQSDRIADYVKPAVVRIFDGCTGKAYSAKTDKTYDLAIAGSGSGFFINPNGFIATNAHVVDLTQTPEECKELLKEQFVYQVIEDSKENINAEAIAESFKLVEFEPISTVLLPNGEKLPFTVKVAGAPVGKGKDVAIIKINVQNAPVLKLGNSDRARNLDPIIAVGFPAAADSDLFPEESLREASFTDGKISARKTLKDGSPVIQISAPTTHGNSGGPVINGKGEVIGMVTFGGNPVYGQQISGFSFIVPSNTIMEFVKQAEIRNEESVVNQKYREGLALYDEGKCKQAFGKFQEVKKLFPQHSEVQHLIQSCVS